MTYETKFDTGYPSPHGMIKLILSVDEICDPPKRDAIKNALAGFKAALALQGIDISPAEETTGATTT